MVVDRLQRAKGPLVVAVLVGASVMSPLPAKAQYLQRQQNVAQQQNQQRAQAPHLASATYSGQLTPFSGLKSAVVGKTVYVERPVVANDTLQRMMSQQIYFSLNNRVYGPTWTGSYTVSGNTLCMTISQRQACLRAFQDSASNIFTEADDHLLAHVVRMANGDSEGLERRFADQRPSQPSRQDPGGEYAASADLAGKLFEQIGKNPSYCYDFLGRYTGNKPGKWNDCDPTRQ